MRIKKFFSLLLTVMLVLSAISITPLSAEIADSKPDAMLHFKTGGNPIYSRVNLAENTKYKLSFNVTNGISGVDIAVCQDGDRADLVITGKNLVKQEDKGSYTYYEYEFTTTTIPVDDWGNYLAFVGVVFNNGEEGYLCDIKLTTEDGDTDLFANGDFKDGLNWWAYGLDVWFASWTTDYDKTEWTNNDNVMLKVENFDESVFSLIEKMLYFKTGANPIYSRVNLAENTKYKLSFNVSDGIGGVDIAVCQDGDRADLVITGKNLVKQEDKGWYTYYEYEFTTTTIPVDDWGNYLAFVGVVFENGEEGYLFDVKLTAENDDTNLFANGDFKDGLNWWAYGLDVWFASWTTDYDKTEWTNNENATLKVEAFDTTKFETIIPKTMFYIKDYKVKGDEVLIQKTENLKPDVEYTVSFDYNENGGTLDETSEINTVAFGIFAGPDFTGLGMKYDQPILCMNQAARNPKGNFTSNNDTGYTLIYTFTLSEDDIKDYTDFYAGFYFMPDPDMVTELYIANLTIYESADSKKKNLFLSDEYETEVTNWYSNWGSTTSDEKAVFSRSECEFTAAYVPYDETLFKAHEPEELIYGDSNEDGVLDILDLVNIKKKIANKEYSKLADITKDKVVDASDVVRLRKHLLGIETIATELDFGLMDSFDLSGGADGEATELLNSINALEDTLPTNGTVYYVAENGTAYNDGKSADKPINVEKVNELSLASGDKVLFKRGDRFRISNAIELRDGVSYGAYGTGKRPEILGSLQNYADKTLWSTTDNKTWSISLGTEDAANVIFNDGESVGYRKSTLEDVRANGDFYYDTTDMTLYLYLSNNNPGEAFTSIEIASTKHLFNCLGSSVDSSRKNVTIQNITLKYSTNHAMNFSFSENFTITGCEIAWIGGSYIPDSTSRYGNAIQFWRYADNCTVENNYIYQIYDAAVTFQGSYDNIYTNLRFNNNLIEYCSMNFEFWASIDKSTPVFKNIDFSSNILRFGGYGFGGLQREEKLNQAYILAWPYTYDSGSFEYFSITNNTFDIANSYYIYASSSTSSSIGINGNTYYRNVDSMHQFAYLSDTYATDLNKFIEAVRTFDSAANVKDFAG